MTRVLIVEDEKSLSAPLAYLLERQGYDTKVCKDGPAALRNFEKHGADLVLLDLMLPGVPGAEVYRQLRSRSGVPIIMLTAKDSERDVVAGLELGADDYITKPYSTQELLARMRAVLRRRNESDEAATLVSAGEVTMNLERHTVAVRDQEVQFPPKEFELLEFLVRNAGRVLTRGQLIDQIWGADYLGDPKTLDVHVKRIRSRIEREPSTPVMLVTVRGLGYRFER